MNCSKAQVVSDSNHTFPALWMFILNQNAKLGLWSITGRNPMAVTCGHWVILALQTSVVRGRFMPQRSRKQSPVISDSEWRLVPPSSWEATLVWCFDWAGPQSVPPTNSISFGSKAEFLFHVTLWLMKQEDNKFQDPWWRNVWSLSSDHQAPKGSLQAYQRREGIMIIIKFPVLWRESESVSRSVQFCSVRSLSHVRLFVTLWIAARQASLSITISWSSLKLMSIESVRPSSNLILCHPLLLLFPIPPSIRVFSNESTLLMRWSKYWSFNFSIIPSKEHPGPISFRMDWLDLLSIQGTLKSLLQHHSSKPSILRRSDFFTVQLSHPYMTTGKTIALTKWTFVGKAFLSNLLTRQIGHSLIWFFVFCTVLTTVHWTPEVGVDTKQQNRHLLSADWRTGMDCLDG